MCRKRCLCHSERLFSGLPRLSPIRVPIWSLALTFMVSAGFGIWTFSAASVCEASTGSCRPLSGLWPPGTTGGEGSAVPSRHTPIVGDIPSRLRSVFVVLEKLSEGVEED